MTYIIYIATQVLTGRPETKKALEAELGWTANTTKRAIQSLLQKGAIRETGQEESSGGRRAAHERRS